MLKLERILRRFNFSLINNDYNQDLLQSKITGVDLFSHAFLLWEKDISFKNKIIIVDSDEIIKGILLNNYDKEHIITFLNELIALESNYILFTDTNNFLLREKLIIDQSQFIILETNYSEEEVFSSLMNYIYRKNAEIKRIHGSLISIFGEGVVIIGKSGIGKSELVLNLLDQNHLFVADDALDIIEFAGELFGTAAPTVKNFLEIRGVGIINVKKAMGIQNVLNSTKITLVIKLEKLEDVKSEIDRLGENKETYMIHNRSLPMITIPVSEGRNLASIIETAVIVHKLKTYDKYNFLEELKQVKKNIDS